MRILKNFLFLAVVILYACPAYATVYQYFDNEGTLIVTDNPYGVKKPKTKPDGAYQIIDLQYRDDVSYNYYPVTGNNFQELLTSVNLNGPIDPGDMKRYAGQTKWSTGWSYKFSSSSTIDGTDLHVSLNIFDIEFMSDITVLLPALQERTKLNHHDLKLWENFVQRLLEHEHDHVKIIRDPFHKNEAIRNISAIKRLTLAYDPRTELDTIIKNAVESATARIGHELIMTIKKQNDEYDRLTDHGLKAEMRDTFFGR